MKHCVIAFFVLWHLAYLHLLAWLEPIMAAWYWPFLSAKSKLEDRRANLQSAGKGASR